MIVRDTTLCDLWRAGRYKEHTVEDAVRVCARILPVFEAAGIPVIRLGLNPTDDLSGGDALGGAYHPALGELVKARMRRAELETLLEGVPEGTDVTVEVPRRLLSQYTGQHGQNREYLREKYRLRSLKLRAADTEHAKRSAS